MCEVQGDWGLQGAGGVTFPYLLIGAHYVSNECFKMFVLKVFALCHFSVFGQKGVYPKTT